MWFNNGGNVIKTLQGIQAEKEIKPQHHET